MTDPLLTGQPVIIGAGLAGLSAALAMAPLPVIVVTKGSLGDGCASAWAQGGIAAAMQADDDPALHAADTIAAGDGLCDAEAVARITAAAPAAIRQLEDWGVRFDRSPGGGYASSLEAAHSRRRVLHVGGGDTAGRRIIEALVARVRETPSITLVEDTTVTGLITGPGGIEGIEAIREGRPFIIPSNRVVMATGGLGGLWAHTTNPPGALGQGLALAARAGAALIDLEFMQFHPTAIDVGADPMPLASEAIRGEGAILIDDLGQRVMADHPLGELAPRDVVARGIWRRLISGRRVFLDAREAVGGAFSQRFPTVFAACMGKGIDPARTPIPIRPAAHYHMGGIVVDRHGRGTVDGLWACGEAAATGLHGANRLASNSLLEAVVTGCAVARDITGTARHSKLARIGAVSPRRSANPALLQRVRALIGQHLGVIRTESGMRTALSDLAEIAQRGGVAGEAAAIGTMVAAAALKRQESRGSHCRSDFPERSALTERHQITLEDALTMAETQKPGLARAIGA